MKTEIFIPKIDGISLRLRRTFLIGSPLLAVHKIDSLVSLRFPILALYIRTEYRRSSLHDFTILCPEARAPPYFIMNHNTQCMCH